MSAVGTTAAAERERFAALVTAALPKARAAVWRMIGHPEDCADVLQDAQAKAWQGFAGFDGRALFSTWLVAIAMRCAIDHLRARGRWRRESQIAYANLCAASDELQGEIAAVMAEPEFRFDVKEHVAYCFVCIGRSLPPDEQATLVLRDVMEFSNREAADVLGTSEAVLRHRLAAARQAMAGRYDGLCALVNKTGMCHQCAGLAQAAGAVANGAALPDVDSLAERMAIVRGVDPERAKSRPLHDLFFRRCTDIEAEVAGGTTPEVCD